MTAMRRRFVSYIAIAIVGLASIALDRFTDFGGIEAGYAADGGSLQMVPVELALLIDVSGSVSQSEYQLQQIIDQRTDPWGIKVSSVEVKHVDLPADMQRAMARQAEAEREKRAKIIHADGEFIASEKLSQAAAVIAVEPVTITLRYLQTLTEIASEKNSTIIFPLPIELLNLIKGKNSGA